MQYVLEHFGVAIGAITGVLAARGKQVDLFGVLVLALAMAFGGGTVRDLVIGSKVFWAADPAFLLNATVTAIAAFYAVRYHEMPETALLVADAFVLAFFTIIGTRKALYYGMAPSVAIAMGVTTGVFGGIIRDVLLNELPIVFRRGTYLYATAALCGGALFVLLRNLEVSPQTAMILGTATVLALRLLGIKWRIGLPTLHLRSSGTPPQAG
jgi:uncharacterized membrane protein YeiH